MGFGSYTPEQVLEGMVRSSLLSLLYKPWGLILLDGMSQWLSPSGGGACGLDTTYYRVWGVGSFLLRSAAESQRAKFFHCKQHKVPLRPIHTHTHTPG